MELKKYSLSTLLILAILSASFSQATIENVYFSFGFYNVQQKQINQNIESSERSFDELNGFWNYSLGTGISFNQLKRISLDLAFDLLTNKRESNRPYGSWDVITIDNSGSEPIITYGNPVVYDYKFDINIFATSLTPNYSIVNGEKFALNLGLGPILYFSRVVQYGENSRFDYSNSTSIIVTSKSDEQTITSNTISWQSYVSTRIRILNNMYLGTTLKYRFGTIKNATESLRNNISNEEARLFPINDQTSVNLSGLVYQLNITFEL